MNSWRGLTLQNTERLGLDNLDIEQQMTYAVGSLMLKLIVVMHSCVTTYVIKHFNWALNFFKSWQTLRVYSSKTICTSAPVNVVAFSECFCHGSLFKTANFSKTKVSLHRHFKDLHYKWYLKIVPKIINWTSKIMITHYLYAWQNHDTVRFVLTRL